MAARAGHCGGMRRVLRWLALYVAGGFILAIASGVVSEFFIELARERDWYASPSDKLDTAMSAFSSFVTQAWFLALTTGLVGLAIGAWGDLFLRRRERRLSKKETNWDEWGRQDRISVIGKAFHNQPVHLDGKSYVSCKFHNATLIYEGKAPFDVANCEFDAPVRIMVGDHRTVALLQLLIGLKLIDQTRVQFIFGVAGGAEGLNRPQSEPSDTRSP